MLEFKDFKLEKNKGSSFTSIKFDFIDEDLSKESLQYMSEKINDYEIYLEYDSKGKFNVEYKKKATIEMIITFPIRKVPEDKKELQNFITRHVMDFKEYYQKITGLEKTYEDDVVEHI
ncbi:MAG: hypothetical protein ACXVHM_08000 [Methanobacterium sp.]